MQAGQRFARVLPLCPHTPGPGRKHPLFTSKPPPAARLRRILHVSTRRAAARVFLPQRGSGLLGCRREAVRTLKVSARKGPCEAPMSELYERISAQHLLWAMATSIPARIEPAHPGQCPYWDFVEGPYPQAFCPARAGLRHGGNRVHLQARRYRRADIPSKTWTGCHRPTACCWARCRAGWSGQVQRAVSTAPVSSEAASAPWEAAQAAAAGPHRERFQQGRTVLRSHRARERTPSSRG